jgi:hypothetical protein
MYKVGDKVRILHTDYPGERVDVGTVHTVKDADSFCVFLDGLRCKDLCFYDQEVEPYTETADHWKDIADALRAGIELALENADYDRAIDLARKLDAIPNP